MKKAAIIGMGTISSIHLDAIRQNRKISLAGVCDINPTKCNKAPAGVPFFTDYRQMIEETRPDVVHICLPHYLHVPVALEAGRMGVHVFLEKPLGINRKQALELTAFEEKHPELHMGICLQNRLNETVELLKKHVDSGEYGKVTGITGLVPWYRSSEYYSESPWRGQWETAGGGCMINQAIHTLDLMCYFAGNVNSVKAICGQVQNYSIEVEDTVAAHLNFENGASGLFFASIANYKNENVQLFVKLEKGEFFIRDKVLYQILSNGETKPLIEDSKLPGTKFYYGASHRKMINKFYNAIENNTKDYLPMREGLASISLIDAIQISAKECRQTSVLQEIST